MELLKRLTEANAPSGNEDAVRNIIIDEIKKYVDDITTDSMGNLICHKKGDGKKLMLCAHMDEIGLIVTYIEDNGFLRCQKVGGIRANYCIAKRVVFLNGTYGIVFAEETDEKTKLSNLYIDIGAKNKAEAENIVKIGDVCCFEGNFAEMGDKVCAKSLDDRVGCYVLINALKNASEFNNDVYAVFSVQEELGLKGATAASYSIEPDIGIAVDVTMTGDTPKADTMAVSLGGGCAVKIKDSGMYAHKKVRDLMIETCEKNDIKYQLEILEGGRTDASAISVSRGGVMSGCVSIPTRYVHSPSEVADKSDIKAATDLLAKIIETKII